MYIYHSKLVNGTSFYHAVEGNFSGLNRPEIVVSCNSVLSLYTLESDGHLLRHCYEDINCKIRSLAVLKWKTRDYVAVASDSGNVLIVCYSPERNAFVAMFKKKFSVPVTLPEFPGEFVATSWGAVAYAARVENFFIYRLYTAEHMEKKEPLFMTQPRFVIYDLVGIQCDNDEVPMFVTLEVLCKKGVDEPDKLIQYLKIYRLEVEKQLFCLEEIPLPHHGNKLIAVPKGKKHPYGVIICYENRLTFRPLTEGYEVTCILPQRKNDAFNSKRGFIISSSAILEVEESSVILVQTEQGDLFSVTLEAVPENKETVMKIIYMDTIPVATAMCIRSGHLFTATEFGDNYIYKIKSLGTESEMVLHIPHIQDEDDEKLYKFEARKLENLSILGKLKSITPVMQSFISDLSCNDLKKFIFACGRGPSSTLRIQRHGVQVTTLFEAPLPPLSPNGVWSVKEEVSGGRVITYVLVSLMTSTMVLAFDKYMYIDNDNGFEYSSPTLNCAQCTHDSVIQVYPSGFRHVRGTYYTEFTTNKTKNKFENAQDILRCAIHGRQIALALVNKDGLYIEIEDVVDKRIRFNQMKTKFTFKSTVMCMEFIPRGNKSEHLAVCLLDSLEIYSVNLTEMKYLYTYELRRMPESLCISTCHEMNAEFNTIIHIGYHDGTLQRIAANEQGMKCEYSMKLGNRPVKLYIGQIHHNVTVLAVSNRPWISFYLRGKLYSFTPLDFDQLDDVTFFSATCVELANLVVISNKNLNVLAVNHWQSMIEDAVMRLTYTPNQLVVNPDNNFIIISETDKRPLFHKLDEVTPQKAMDLALEPPKPPLTEQPKVKRLDSVWDSLLHIIDPVNVKTIFKQPIPLNEAVVCMSLMRFKEGNPLYLLVGIQTGNLLEGMNRESQIYIYEVSADGTSFKLVNKMVVEDLPKAICPIEGYVLIAIGYSLCLYSFHQDTKRLVRCAVEESKTKIEAIWTKGICLVVKTADDRITYGYLNMAESTLFMIHEDRDMRAVTDVCFWDDDVIFVATKNCISAVLLPYYEGCIRPPPQLPDPDPDLIKLMEEAAKLKISDPIPSTSQADEAGPSTSGTRPSSPQPGPSTSRARQSSQVGTSFKIKPLSARPRPSQAEPSTSRVGPFQAEPSTSRVGPFQAEPSTSRVGPFQAELSTSKDEPLIYNISSPSGTSVQEDIYQYPFLRFQEYSYTLAIHRVREYVNSLQKTSLIKDGREVIVYVTASGIVGVLVPFLNETHHKFFGPLEYLSFKANPVLDSEWLAPLNPCGDDIYDQCYEDQYVIDATACEAYIFLERSLRQEIATKLGASVQEVLQKIEEMKRTIYF